jgi:hypothetical protein
MIVSFKRKNPDLWKALPDELDTSVGAAVVYDKDFMIAALVLDGPNHMGQTFFKKVFPIPIEYLDRGCGVRRMTSRPDA